MDAIIQSAIASEIELAGEPPQRSADDVSESGLGQRFDSWDPGWRTGNDHRFTVADGASGAIPSPNWDQVAAGRFLTNVAECYGRPTPPSGLCPQRHQKTGQPLLHHYYDFVPTNGPGGVAVVPYVKVAGVRPSGLDRLILSLPSVIISEGTMNVMAGLGFAIVPNRFRRTLSVRYGPLYMQIWSMNLGRPDGRGRRLTEHRVTLNPYWFQDFGSLICLLRAMFTGFKPETAAVSQLDAFCDFGLGSDMFRAMLAENPKVNSTIFYNDVRSLTGKANGMQSGSGNDVFVEYDKCHEKGFRKPHLRELLADVPWSRMERRIKGKAVPIRTLADLPDLIEFEPFVKRKFRLATVHDDKVMPTQSNWRPLIAKLIKFKTILERENQARAVQAINGQGHFSRLVRQGYIGLQDIPIDIQQDWVRAINDFCSPGGGLTPVETHDMGAEDESGYV